MRQYPAIKVGWTNATHPITGYGVAVYAVDSSYGGPEEGGWWYDTGELIEVEIWPNQALAKDRAEALRVLFPATGKGRSFSTDREDYQVRVFDCLDGLPPMYFPEERPHYE